MNDQQEQTLIDGLGITIDEYWEDEVNDLRQSPLNDFYNHYGISLVDRMFWERWGDIYCESNFFVDRMYIQTFQNSNDIENLIKSARSVYSECLKQLCGGEVPNQADTYDVIVNLISPEVVEYLKTKGRITSISLENMSYQFDNAPQFVKEIVIKIALGLPL